MGMSGEQIGKELIPFLNKVQKKELIQFLKSYSAIINHNFFKRDFEPTDIDLTEMYFGKLYICLEYRLVSVSGQPINLTAKEFDILARLIMHPKRVFTYEMIMELVWNEDYTFYSRKAINNHISNLRKKLNIAPDIPDYIKSVYGVGYKFEV